MKKVIAFIASERRKWTWQAVQALADQLKQLGDVDFEAVFLSDYHLEFCRGCTLCFNKGEGHCPLKDDRDVLLDKLQRSDGVIFAAPSYAFQIPARMKNFLDRIAFVFHRPRYFGKVFTSVIAQGMPMGGNAIRKYLESCGGNMGFHVVKGGCVWTLEPMPEGRRKKIEQDMGKLAARFHRQLVRTAPPVPSYFRLMLFRFSRSGIRQAPVELLDHGYYREHGWFESDYYHETALGPAKKLAGSLCDIIGRRIFSGSMGK